MENYKTKGIKTDKKVQQKHENELEFTMRETYSIIENNFPNLITGNRMKLYPYILPVTKYWLLGYRNPRLLAVVITTQTVAFLLLLMCLNFLKETGFHTEYKF